MVQPATQSGKGARRGSRILAFPLLAPAEAAAPAFPADGAPMPEGRLADPPGLAQHWALIALQPLAPGLRFA
eukprot:3982155-Alexandrium_andersonii.AAC.1